MKIKLSGEKMTIPMQSGSPLDHGFTPEQNAISKLVKDLLTGKTIGQLFYDSNAENLRSWIVSLVGYKSPEQWTSDEWDMLATHLDMPLSFYR